MALRVWLPLTGTLENKGIGNLTVVSGTPSYKTPGKLGTSALNLNTRITFDCPQLANLQTFSVAFWGIAQNSNTLTTNWQDLLGFTDVSSGNSNGTFRWETTYASTNGIHWHDNATNALVNGSHNHITVKEQWVHCCVVFNFQTGKIYSYDNGILTQTHNHAGGHFNANGRFYLGETNNIEGMIQDVRFYDHALSAAEVKEISQGLVLHYKLDDITNGIQDSSGYGHNGSILNTVTISSDTPRYSSSISLPNGNSMINCGRDGMVTDSITVNFWCKYSSWGNPVSCTEGGGWNMENNGGSITFPVYISSVGYVHSKSGPNAEQLPPANYANAWHMFTGTYNKTEKTVSLYIDGELKQQNTASAGNNIAYHSSNCIWIGAEATSSSTTASNGMAGLFSDFRIYCTALSTDDIKQLYQVSAKVDNLGGLHTFELNENGSNKLTKTGIFKDYMVEPFITLTDGSKWQLILYHYVDGGNNLFTQSNATFCNDFGLYSRLAYIDNFTYNNGYEFYVLQDDLAYRWTQTNKPTATSPSGFTAIDGYTNPVQGLVKPSNLTQTYIGYNSWWGACGCWTSYTTGGKTGIPGFGTHNAAGMCTRYLALYARISEPKFHIANLTVYANNLIER